MAASLFATSEFVDNATLSSSGTISSSLPLTNLQTLQLSEVCRFTSLTGMEITVDLTEAKTIDFVALFGHNASSTATWQIRGASSEADLTASPGYDSGSISMWPSTGKSSDTGYTRWPSIHVISTTQNFRWWRIDITDASNDDGFFEAGRLYIDDAFQPALGINFGWGLGWADPSPIDIALGGQLHPTARPVRRVVEFSLTSDKTGANAENEFYNNLFELQHKRGSQNDIVFIRDPDATTHLHRQLVYGLMTQLSPIINRTYRLFEQPFRIEELVP